MGCVKIRFWKLKLKSELSKYDIFIHKIINGSIFVLEFTEEYESEEFGCDFYFKNNLVHIFSCSKILIENFNYELYYSE